jgi:hypothetical protein
LRKVVVVYEHRPDGGLRAYSDDVPGFVLSNANAAAVRDDVIPALEGIISDMIGAPVRVELRPGQRGCGAAFLCREKGPLNTAEWWKWPWPNATPFLVPIEDDGSLEYWAFHRIKRPIWRVLLPTLGIGPTLSFSLPLRLWLRSRLRDLP